MERARPFSVLSTGKIKLRNKLNFSDTASACFLVRNIFDSFEYVLYYPYDLHELSKGFQAFHGGHLSLKMCARNKGNKWYSSSSKGPFHRKYRTFWSHVIHSSVTDPAKSISGKGWQALHLYCNFERLLLKIFAVSRRTKRFTLFFVPDWLPVPSVFCFCQW